MSILLALAIVIGDLLPALPLKTLAGEQTTLSVKNGRPLVIDLFASWCGPCRKSIPVVERLRQRFGAEIDFVSIAEEDDAQAVSRFVDQMKIQSRVLLDGDRSAYRRLGAHTLPTTFVVDGFGVVCKINHGFGSGYEARMTKWLQSLLEKR